LRPGGRRQDQKVTQGAAIAEVGGALERAVVDQY